MKLFSAFVDTTRTQLITLLTFLLRNRLSHIFTLRMRLLTSFLFFHLCAFNQMLRQFLAMFTFLRRNHFSHMFVLRMRQLTSFSFSLPNLSC
jgi:hypothetical protein